MRLPITLAACATLALAACGAPADETADAPAADETSAAAEQGATPAPDGDDPSPTPTATDTGGTASIPEALRGRWGLVPADCTSTRGDAKGLITVTANQVRFYESVATLDSVSQRSGDSIRATYSFTGEGMTWSRDMSLVAGNGGSELTRREFGEDAMAGALTYTECD